MKSDFLKIIESLTGQFECHYYIMYEREDMLSLLIYHKPMIHKILACTKNRQYLEACGCSLEGNMVNNILGTLKHKLYHYYGNRVCRMPLDMASLEAAGFPHEIGIILGYPLRDVEDFVKYKGKNCILCGYWKVYHNAEEAVKTFDRYQKLRENAMALIGRGRSINTLAAKNDKM